ncbi:MAG: hypothetical protein Q7U54_15270 [Bacteroidales bacterium]|nr:hypothetical protein [Bacteroidales bacterium]
MKSKKIKKKLFIILISGIFIIGCLVLIAYSRTWGKTDMEFNIHINEQLIRESVFGESPTFAIWIEDPKNGVTQTVFVTSRAGLGDWEGKTDVPVALPKWFEVIRAEKQLQNQSTNKNPTADAITGATPKPGYFTSRVRVTPGSKWICWIEMNLSGDFNEQYKEYDEVNKTTDEYASGQPALIYKAEIEAAVGNTVMPEIVGMCLLNTEDEKIIQPLKGITTAMDVFDEINIAIIKPKPRIIMPSSKAYGKGMK